MRALATWHKIAPPLELEFALRTLVPPLIAGAFLLGVSALAHSATDTIDVHALKRGMKGYGLTVFRGDKPERFEAEVLDVLHNFRPDQDLILIRTRHPVLDQAIVVAGMSGSPVYFDGKLAGAYAYGWSFGKEPVVGVTPIANMLAELARPVNPALWQAIGTLPKQLSRAEPPHVRADSPDRFAGLPPYLGLEHSDAFAGLRKRAAASPYAAAQASEGLRPAATPLMLSGFDERVSRMLDTELARFGLLTVQAGGAGAHPTANQARPRFEDGGSIGVALVRGDVSATAIGTVTRVVGDKLVAFGHPMLGLGQPALPTCTARVVHVLASQSRSFKLAEIGPPLGTLIHDRQAAIVIDQSLEADTIPVRVKITGVTGAPRTEWNMLVASERSLTPMLALGAIGNALSVTAGEHSDVTFNAKSRVQIQGHGTIEVSDVGYTPFGLEGTSALGQLRLFDVVDAAYGNPFEPARIERIELELDVRFERDVITILDALVPSTEVDPDRDVGVYLTLQRFGMPEETRIVPVHVPASAAGEKIELAFEGGSRVQLERPEPRNLDQIFDIVREAYPATSLVVSQKLASQGLRLRGQVVKGLPGSALDTLQLQGEGTRPTTFTTYARDELPLMHVVFGSARVTLDVRREPLR